MTPADRTSQRHATLSVLGILAIPIASVSSAALIAGPVSSADPVGVVTGIVASLAGVFVGLVILRAVRATIEGVRAAAMAAVGRIDAWSVAVYHAPSVRMAALPVSSPSASHITGPAQRRGPPRGL